MLSGPLHYRISDIFFNPLVANKVICHLGFPCWDKLNGENDCFSLLTLSSWGLLISFLTPLPAPTLPSICLFSLFLFLFFFSFFEISSCQQTLIKDMISQTEKLLSLPLPTECACLSYLCCRYREMSADMNFTVPKIILSIY